MHEQDSIAAAIGAVVDAGKLAGAVALAWREGKGAEVTCVGWRDMATRLPMERDTIFRIASMTKPITSTAALMLLDEGRFRLDDPISRWAPEFAADAGPAFAHGAAGPDGAGRSGRLPLRTC